MALVQRFAQRRLRSCRTVPRTLQCLRVAPRPLAPTVPASAWRVVSSVPSRTAHSTSYREGDPLSPEEKYAREQLAKGNEAEAYGLSEKAGAIGKSGVWKEYGVLASAGFATVIALSKEYIILNEELLIAALAGGVAFTGYVTFRDTVYNSMKQEQDQQRSEWEHVFDESIAGCQQIVSIIDEMDGSLAFQKTQVDPMYSAIAAANKAKAIRYQIAVNQYFDSILAAQEQREQRIVADHISNAITHSDAQTRTKFENMTDQNRGDLLKWSLSTLEAVVASKPVPKHPVDQVYVSAIKQYDTDVKARRAAEPATAPEPIPKAEFQRRQAEIEAEWNRIPTAEVPSDAPESFRTTLSNLTRETIDKFFPMSKYPQIWASYKRNF